MCEALALTSLCSLFIVVQLTEPSNAQQKSRPVHSHCLKISRKNNFIDQEVLDSQWTMTVNSIQHKSVFIRCIFKDLRLPVSNMQVGADFKVVKVALEWCFTLDNCALSKSFPLAILKELFGIYFDYSKHVIVILFPFTVQ